MGFLLMLQTLTRIPVRRTLPCTQADFRRAAIWFAPVGLVLGLLSLSVAFAGSWALGRPIGAALHTLSLVLLTGALHNDGLADCFDAFFCHRDREGMLAILKDSRMGAYGTLALIFDIGLRILAASALPWTWLWFLAGVPMLGRACIAWVAATSHPARAGGSGALFIGNISKPVATFGLLATVIGFAGMGWGLGGWLSALIAVACTGLGFLAAVAFQHLCTRKLGGLTGDCLGACCELAELTVLLGLVAGSRLCGGYA